MQKIDFKKIKKRYPKEAKEFVNEQEALVLFMNSSEKDKILSKLKFTTTQKSKIKKVIDKYALCKIKHLKKYKKLSRKDVIHIEDQCLKNVFEAHLIRLNVNKKEALKITAKILEKEYKGCVILNDTKLNRLSKLINLNKKFPEDFWVFEPNKKKVIGINIVWV